MDRRTRTFLIVGLLVTFAVAVGVSQFASGNPDGLEYVAEREGFADTAEDHALIDTALADYGEGLTDNTVVDTAIAGLVGVLVTLGVGWVIFRVIRRGEEVDVSS